jgi:hypothetical protein
MGSVICSDCYIDKAIKTATDAQFEIVRMCDEYDVYLDENGLDENGIWAKKLQELSDKKDEADALMKIAQPYIDRINKSGTSA